MIRKIRCLFLIFGALLTDCSSTETESRDGHSTLIGNSVEQDTLFINISRFINTRIDKNVLDDSLAFLILPLEVTCPSCRNKAIDSIATYNMDLGNKHFVIISGKGRRSINGYFKVRDKTLPVTNNIILDTLNTTFSSNLSSTNPVIYYAYNRKVYMKVSCLPSTIKSDLRNFFSKINK